MESTMQQLVDWALSQGVQLTKIAPEYIEGRGIGIVATDHIQKDDIVMVIPMTAARSLHNLPDKITLKMPDSASIQTMLASDAALRGFGGECSAWTSLVPAREIIMSSLPYFWNPKLQGLLPYGARAVLKKHKALVKQSWNDFVQSGLNMVGEKEITKRQFEYVWFLVNTRAFYHETPETLLFPWNDRLALLPVADLFNHAVTLPSSSTEELKAICAPLKVNYTDEYYEFVAQREYKPGEEVYSSYGAHTNDFLLAEYGFILPDDDMNDAVCLDEIVEKKLGVLSAEERASFGDDKHYLLYAESASINLKLDVALRAISLKRAGKEIDFEALWARREDEDELMDESVDDIGELLRDILLDLELQVMVAVDDLGESTGEREMVLLDRWMQIRRIVEDALTCCSMGLPVSYREEETQEED